jgi:hypothetical protein
MQAQIRAVTPEEQAILDAASDLRLPPAQAVGAEELKDGPSDVAAARRPVVDLAPELVAPDAVHAAIADMARALDVEIRAVALRPTNPIRLREGILKQVSAGVHEYEFRISRRARVRADEAVQIRIPGKEAAVEGVVLHFGDGLIKIESVADLGEHVSAADMVEDKTWLLRKAKERLEAVSRGEEFGFNIPLAAKSVGLEKPESPTAMVEVSAEGLNPEQQAAVSNGNSSELVFLWGPPGTGKTQVLAHNICELDARGESVILLANSNQALDTALLRLCSEMERRGDKEFLAAGKVVRVGPIVIPELQERYGHLISPEAAAVHAFNAARGGDGDRLKSQEAECERLIAAADLSVGQIKEMNPTPHLLKRLEADLTAVRSQETSKRALLKRYQGEAQKRPLGGVIGAVVKRLRHQDDTRRQAFLHKEIADLTEWCAKAVFKASLIASKLEALRAYERLREVKRAMKALDKEVESYQEAAIGSAKILALTIAQSYLSSKIPWRFDAVIIDEASMVAIPFVFWAAGLARQRVMVAGDYCQLAPIVTARKQGCSPEEWATLMRWMGTDAFEAAGITSDLRAGRRPFYLSALSTQYRMAEPICDLCNQVSYAIAGNPLRTPEEVKARPTGSFAFGEGHLFYVNSARAKSVTEPGLNRNVVHGQLVHGLLQKLREAGTTNVGVITPFRGEMEHIQDRLDAAGGYEDVRVATVHGFQGSEMEVIIFDLMSAPGAGLGVFMRGVEPTDTGTRLLNVAVSRARTQLVVVAHFDFLTSNRLPRPGAIRTLLETVRKHGSEILPAGLLDAVPATVEVARGMGDANAEAYLNEIGAFESVEEPPNEG